MVAPNDAVHSMHGCERNDKSVLLRVLFLTNHLGSGEVTNRVCRWLWSSNWALNDEKGSERRSQPLSSNWISSPHLPIKLNVTEQCRPTAKVHFHEWRWRRLSFHQYTHTIKGDIPAQRWPIWEHRLLLLLG